MQEKTISCHECEKINKIDALFCRECGVRLQDLKNEADEADESEQTLNVNKKKKFLLLKIFITLTVLLSITVVYFFLNKDDSKLESVHDYYGEIYIYENQENDTYVYVNGKSILLDDKEIFLNINYTQNKPLNDLISPVSYDSYLSKDLIVLESIVDGIFILNVKTEEVKHFEHANYFQVSEDAKSILVFSDTELLLVDVESLNDKKIIDEVLSFIARPDFKTIFVQVENELLMIDIEGQEIQRISKEMNQEADEFEEFDSSLADNIFCIIDTYLFYKTVDDHIVYNIKDHEVIDKYDDFNYSSLISVEGNIHFIAEDNLYMIKDNNTKRVDKDVSLLYQDNSLYYDDADNYKLAYENRLTLYWTEDDKFYHNREEFIELNIENDEVYITWFNNDAELYNNKGQYRYFAEDNDWQGRDIDLKGEDIVAIGHNYENILYYNKSLVTDDRVYFFNGDKSITLSFSSEKINTLYTCANKDYMLELDDSIVYVSSTGKEEEVYSKNDIESSIYLYKSNEFYFTTSEGDFYVYTPGVKEAEFISDNILFTSYGFESVMYLEKDSLMIYENGQSKEVSSGVEELFHVLVEKE